MVTDDADNGKYNPMAIKKKLRNIEKNLSIDICELFGSTVDMSGASSKLREMFTADVLGMSTL